MVDGGRVLGIAGVIAVLALAVAADGQLERVSELIYQRLLAVAGNRPKERRNGVLPQHHWKGPGCPQPRRRRCGHLSVPRPLTGSAHNAAGMGQLSCVHRLCGLRAPRGYPWAGERAWGMMLGRVGSARSKSPM